MSGHAWAWAALDSGGLVSVYTIARTRSEAMDRATKVMMPASEYERRGGRSYRWNYCYRRGCRLIPVKITKARTHD